MRRKQVGKKGLLLGLFLCVATLRGEKEDSLCFNVLSFQDTQKKKLNDGGKFPIIYLF